MKKSVIARPIVALSMGVATLLASTGPADAAPPLESFCYNDGIYSGCTSFYLYWSNRTTRISGRVVSGATVRATYASFASYVGSTETNRQTRTANGPSIQKGFNFTLGDPDLRGDLTQIKAWVCVDTGVPLCSSIRTFNRP